MDFSLIKLRRFALAVLIATLSLLLLWPNGSAATVTTRDNGSDIFRSRCAVCHGVDGSGHTDQGRKLKTPDLRSDDVQKLTDDDLLDVITFGKNEMPAFEKKLSRENVQQVIVHLRKLGAKG